MRPNLDKEIIVTDEMAAGLREFDHIKDTCPDYLLVVQVYKAMRLAAAGKDLGDKQSDE